MDKDAKNQFLQDENIPDEVKQQYLAQRKMLGGIIKKDESILKNIARIIMLLLAVVYIVGTSIFDLVIQTPEFFSWAKQKFWQSTSIVNKCIQILRQLFQYLFRNRYFIFRFIRDIALIIINFVGVIRFKIYAWMLATVELRWKIYELRFKLTLMLYNWTVRIVRKLNFVTLPVRRFISTMLKTTLKTLFSIIKMAFQFVNQRIVAPIYNSAKVLFQIIQRICSNIFETIRNQYKCLKNLLKIALVFINSQYVSLKIYTLKLIRAGCTFIIQTSRTAKVALFSAIEKYVVSPFFSGIAFVKECFLSLLIRANTVLNFVDQQFRYLYLKMFSVLKIICDGIFKIFASISEKVKRIKSDLLNFVRNAYQRILKAIVDLVNKVIRSLTAALDYLGTIVYSAIKFILNEISSRLIKPLFSLTKWVFQKAFYITQALFDFCRGIISPVFDFLMDFIIVKIFGVISKSFKYVMSFSLKDLIIKWVDYQLGKLVNFLSYTCNQINRCLDKIYEIIMKIGQKIVRVIYRRTLSLVNLVMNQLWKLIPTAFFISCIHTIQDSLKKTYYYVKNSKLIVVIRNLIPSPINLYQMIRKVFDYVFETLELATMQILKPQRLYWALNKVLSLLWRICIFIWKYSLQPSYRLICLLGNLLEYGCEKFWNIVKKTKFLITSTIASLKDRIIVIIQIVKEPLLRLKRAVVKLWKSLILPIIRASVEMIKVKIFSRVKLGLNLLRMQLQLLLQKAQVLRQQALACLKQQLDFVKAVITRTFQWAKDSFTEVLHFMRQQLIKIKSSISSWIRQIRMIGILVKDRCKQVATRILTPIKQYLIQIKALFELAKQKVRLLFVEIKQQAIRVKNITNEALKEIKNQSVKAENMMKDTLKALKLMAVQQKNYANEKIMALRGVVQQNFQAFRLQCSATFLPIKVAVLNQKQQVAQFIKYYKEQIVEMVKQVRDQSRQAKNSIRAQLIERKVELKQKKEEWKQELRNFKNEILGRPQRR